MEKQVEKKLNKIRNLSNELNIQYQSMIDSCKEIENIIDGLSQDIYKLGEELK
tara:strand:- start:672 stop:830 length:159 start_codon:yes stop_codon:yes gene_type:complete